MKLTRYSKHAPRAPQLAAIKPSGLVPVENVVKSTLYRARRS